jgi:hypothetical protein
MKCVIYFRFFFSQPVIHIFRWVLERTSQADCFRKCITAFLQVALDFRLLVVGCKPYLYSIDFVRFRYIFLITISTIVMKVGTHVVDSSVNVDFFTVIYCIFLNTI